MKDSRLFLLLLIISASFVLWTVNYGEISGIPDTHAHTMLGVFFADFIREGAFIDNIQNIMNYIWNYYAHYNNISLLHWPHFFHVVEGLFFIIFGISAIAARFLAFLFFMLGLSYFYRLLRLMYDPVTAFSASILYLSCPLILFHARIVSLEIPSVSLCLMATFYFYRYATDGKPRDGLLLAIATSLALLTKQTSVYLLLFYAAFSLYQYYSKGTLIFSWKSAALYLSIIVLLVLPSYGLSFYFHSSVIVQDSFKGIRHYLDYKNYVYYILNLHKQLSITTIVLLGAALVSYVLPPRKPLPAQDFFLLAWAASCYLLFTVLGSKEPRYIIYWVPSLCAVAALPVTRGAARLASRVAGLGQARLTGLLVSLLALTALSEAMAAPRSYISGYEEVSHYLLTQVARGQKEIVFYDGDFPCYGAITFAARKADPERRIYFFRSSKFLFAKAIFTTYAFWQIRTNEEDIKDFFKKYGIRFILINFLTDPEEENIPVIQILRDMLQHDPDFRLVKKFPIVYQMDHGGEMYSHQGDLLLYTYLQAPPLPGNLDLEIPMPSIGKTITIRLP